MREYWNDGWKFQAEYQECLVRKEFDDSNLQTVRLPHTNVITPYHYFDAASYQGVCGYRKKFTAHRNWQQKQVLLTFEGAAHEATVYINGMEVYKHKNGYSAFAIDIEPYLTYEEENVLTVRLDTRETLNQPPFGNVIDYMTYGGIYREVYIEVKEQEAVEDIFVYITGVTQEDKKLHILTTISDAAYQKSKKGNIRVEYRLLDGEKEFIKELLTQKSIAGASLEENIVVRDVKLWDTFSPVLYHLQVRLLIGNQIMDEKTIRFGFREMEFRADGFYLNGKRFKLRGLNRHQCYAYAGYAMPESMQRKDVDILLDELGVNAVRTSHYPQSQYFYDACDERGLLVFTEFPGWQHIGDEEWKKIACQNVREMILENRNHPSIMLWGVRINESVDDDAFYERTNGIAHALDPSRQTGGVRFIQKSHLLEDVYTYNDFVHTGKNPGVCKKKKVTPDMNKGYLISEYNGHMYPTKVFDKESVRLEHALRHARVINDYYKEENIAGGFGWCMFDYNTHKDFGSGDRICYHGVMDMFRNPKLAAAVYASQQDKEIVCEISSTMDIGEHPGGSIGDVYAFTNGDSIRVYKNDKFVKEFYPDTKRFASMVHPPIILDDFVGELLEKGEPFSEKVSQNVKEVLLAIQKYGQNSLPLKYILKMARLMVFHHFTVEKGVELYNKYIGNWGGKVTTYRFEVIKAGKVVKTIIKEPTSNTMLKVSCSHTHLKEGRTYDVAAVRFEMTDQNGNRLPFYQQPVALSVSGDIELIGPDIISLKGGMGGTYIKTTKSEGNGILQIRLEDGTTTEVAFNIASDIVKQ